MKLHEAIAKVGAKARRPGQGLLWHVERLSEARHFDNDESAADPCDTDLVEVNVFGRMVPFIPNAEDVLADDWEVIE